MLTALQAVVGKRGQAVEKPKLPEKSWVRSVTCGFYVRPRRRTLSDTQ